MYLTQKIDFCINIKKGTIFNNRKSISRFNTMSSATIRDLRVYDVFREIPSYMLFDMIYISTSFLNNVILLYLGVCFICENTFTNKQWRRLSIDPWCAWIWTLISRQHHVSTKTNIFK